MMKKCMCKVHTIGIYNSSYYKFFKDHLSYLKTYILFGHSHSNLVCVSK